MGRSGLSTGALLHCQVSVVGRGGSAQLGVGELSGGVAISAVKGGRGQRRGVASVAGG
jgi:hypothetical protein